ncbi:MAG: hypothetical protein II842_09205 [Butyrivibrio sp.]|nr:hypothetical protein [Butyrivibrio sp.]
MDVVVNAIDTAIDFTKNTINKAMDIWESFDEDKKKLYIGCAVAALCVIVIAGIAYGIGKAQGRKSSFEDDDF